MLQFTPANFFFDEPNLAKKHCSLKRALRTSRSVQGIKTKAILDTGADLTALS